MKVFVLTHSTSKWEGYEDITLHEDPQVFTSYKDAVAYIELTVFGLSTLSRTKRINRVGYLNSNTDLFFQYEVHTKSSIDPLLVTFEIFERYLTL